METGDGASDAPRPVSPLQGTYSSALEAAHPDAKVRARKCVSTYTNEMRFRQDSMRQILEDIGIAFYCEDISRMMI